MHRNREITSGQRFSRCVQITILTFRETTFSATLRLNKFVSAHSYSLFILGNCRSQVFPNCASACWKAPCAGCRRHSVCKLLFNRLKRRQEDTFCLPRHCTHVASAVRRNGCVTRAIPLCRRCNQTRNVFPDLLVVTFLKTLFKTFPVQD